MENSVVPPPKTALHSEWVLSVVCPVQQGTRTRAAATAWADRLHAVPPFASVEDFWAVYEAVAPPSALQSGGEIYVFRETGQPPSWETWPTGGQWRLPVAASSSGESVDGLWLSVLLALLGEQLTEPGEAFDEVVGATICVRSQGYRIGVWTRNAAEEALQKRIGARLLAHARAAGADSSDEDAPLAYVPHVDARQGKSVASTPPRFTMEPDATRLYREE